MCSLNILTGCQVKSEFCHWWGSIPNMHLYDIVTSKTSLQITLQIDLFIYAKTHDK